MGLLTGEFHQFLTALPARDFSFFFSFSDDNFSKYQWIFMKLGMCIDIEGICFGIVNGQISFILTVICQRHFHIFVSGQKRE